MDGSGHMARSELRGRTSIQHDGALRLQAGDLGRAYRHRRRNLVERGSAQPVQLSITAEVFGTGRHDIGEETDELLAGRRLKRIVGAPLFANSGGAFGTHLPAAKRSRSMRGKDLRLIRKPEQLLMQALVQHGSQLLRSVVAGKIG